MNYAVNLAQQIIDGKTPTHAQLGVSLSTVNAQNAKRYGLSVDEDAYVAAVSEGSGAAEAGLQEGDIVTKFDGKDVASASDLMLDVRSKNPGDKVTLDVNRNGETKQVEVTLGSDESSQSASTQQNSAQESMLERLFGGGSGSSRSRTSPSLGATRTIPSLAECRIEQDATLRASARPCGIFPLSSFLQRQLSPPLLCLRLRVLSPPFVFPVS